MEEYTNGVVFFLYTSPVSLTGKSHLGEREVVDVSEGKGLDPLAEFNNKDYSQWVKLMRRYSQFRNYRESDLESGYEEVYCLREGFYIRVLSLDILKTNSIKLTFAGKHFLFCFKLKGTNILRSSSSEEFVLTPLSIAMYYFDQDEFLEDFCEGGNEYLMVMLIVDPKVMTEIPFSYESDAFPDLLKPAFHKKSVRIEFLHTFGSNILATAMALVERKVMGEHERLYIGCKSAELLCLVFHDLSLLEANIHLNHFSQKDLKALESVKGKLDSSLQNVPSISDMAKEFEISESRLKTGFKSLYGLHVRGYVLGLRMQKGQQLLMDRRINIDRIAWDLGYQHTSSFITAFKQHTGMTPKFYQDHLAASASE